MGILWYLNVNVWTIVLAYVMSLILIVLFIKYYFKED